MDDNMSKENYNTVKEMILDENKLVTYVSISKDLCIHVNESKRLLGEIVDHIKKSKPDVALNVSYIISGLTGDKNALTTVCSESEIDGVRQGFKIVFFQHVYSVRKGYSLIDNVALLSVNKFEDFPLCTGLIKNNMCIKRSMDEISNLKSNSQEVAVSDTKIVNTQSKNKETKKETCKTSGESSLNNTKSNIETKEITVKTEAVSPKPDKKVNNKSNKGIAGFFSKSNGFAPKKSKTDASTTSLPSVVKAEKDEKVIEAKKQEKPVQVKEEKMEVDNVEIREVPSKTKSTSKDLETKAKNKSLNNIKKNAKVDKKRKRVLQVSDSESDDEKNDPFADTTPVNNPAFESDDEIPPTPTINTVKITSGIVNPKKRRKIVDKTYTDEDGYILTKKEEVYESCSDNEMEVETKENKQQVNQVKVEVSPSKKLKVEVSPNKKQNGTKNGKKKVSPPQKGKQATLMSFFKKV